MVEYMNVDLKDGELSGGGPRQKFKVVNIFVAYRFHSTESINFREELESRLLKTDSLSDVRVIDGRQILLGNNWSSQIRKAIEQSRVVVAELTALSPEVLFECGYAYGLGRPILPVVENSTWDSRLPRWLTTFQMGNFSSESGWKEIVDSIDQIVNKTGPREKTVGLPEADPGYAVWLPGTSLFEVGKDSLVTVTNRFDMNSPHTTFEVSDLFESSELVIEEVAKSSLLIASVGGISADTFVHFACGIVVSKPKTGVSNRKIMRRVILVVSKQMDKDKILSDSARRASHVVQIVNKGQLNDALIRYGEIYRRWRNDCGKE